MIAKELSKSDLVGQTVLTTKKLKSSTGITFAKNTPFVVKSVKDGQLRVAMVPCQCCGISCEATLSRKDLKLTTASKEAIKQKKFGFFF